jgi:myo-inositol 2-dehydrogenase/D-chiro-inositol 1-dehydrogenase
MKSPHVFPPATDRRAFLRRSTGLAAAAAVAPFVVVRPRVHAANSDTLKVGLVGCGGRGTGAASQALHADKNVVLHAVGDIFPDRLKGSLEQIRKEHGERTMVTPDTSFLGFDAIDKVLGSGVDVVVLATPPGFRPYHLRKCIEAGKHVFCEKPMATDGPGVRMVLEAAALAKQKKLALTAGFCWRYNPAEREVMKRIHDGQIGTPLSLKTTYNTGSLWVRPRQPDWNDMTYQMRNWYYFTWLSGDHLVEQAVHSLDKMQWALKDEVPAKCVAHGGRQVRTGADFGHIYDHFAVAYEYASGAQGYHFSRQQANTASDNSDFFMGTAGTAQIKAFGPIFSSPARIPGSCGGAIRLPNMYQVEHNEMYASIRWANRSTTGCGWRTARWWPSWVAWRPTRARRSPGSRR